jgi:hypothetical protein
MKRGFVHDKKPVNTPFTGCEKAVNVNISMLRLCLCFWRIAAVKYLIKETYMEKIYSDFDALLAEINAVIVYANQNPHLIFSRESEIKHTRYSGNDDALGFASPSLVIDKITSGYRKGRPLKAKPSSESYSVYDFSEDMNPIRIQKINGFGRVVSIWFFNHNSAIYAVPFSEETVSPVDGGVYKIEYNDNKIIRFSHISGSSLWQENYTYSSLSDGLIVCDQYYYVPNLKDSSKSIPIGKTGSPAQLVRMNVYIDDNGKVIKVDYI